MNLRVLIWCGVVWTLIAVWQRAEAQTLTEQLISEDPRAIAQQARDRGDIVRGAILFHQGNINCAKCHRPSTSEKAIGPNLGQMTIETTDAQIIDSILQPSKDIKQGFEPLVIQTIDGRIISGLVVSSNEQVVVVRDIQDADKLIEVAVSDIEESKPGKISSMPAGLADELSGRQQFLDLVRYVFDVRERGPGQPNVDGEMAEKRQPDEIVLGHVLINQRNCAACHQAARSAQGLATKGAPNLKWSAKNIYADYLVDFIANPQQTKPGTTMPDMLNHLAIDSRKDAAQAIVHFLKSREDVEQVGSGEPIVSDSISTEATKSGDELFHSVGCVACHSPRDSLAAEKPNFESVAMGELRRKYQLSTLIEFLENPHLARPSGRMPSFRLTHREAIDIASFLLQPSDGSAENSNGKWKIDETLAKKGGQLFSEFGCAKCHTGIVEAKQEDLYADSLAALDEFTEETIEKGCLGENSSTTPEFHLSDVEQTPFARRWLVRAISSMRNI
ncbi:MAG: c-type cytochrome [Pirellulaceae bacterium]